MSAPISRRRALVLGGAGVVAVVAGTTGWIATADNGPGLPDNGSGAAETGAELGAPPLLDSSEGRLQIELVAAPGVRLAGRDTRALGFNGTSPGPTLRVRPGDELAVRLTNRLDQPTNLHTHGLRVSPQGNSDNPFLRVDPGTSFDYLIRVPTDHPAGTHWYHPHHHGTVADQVSGGLAGALIVDGGPALPVAADRVLLISDITLDTTGTPVPASPMERMQGREGALVLVNGQHQPAIPAVPQATQRWRIVNTCVARVLSLRLEGHPLVQIAHDGTYLPAPARHDRLVLAPGSRADVLVTPTGTGRFAARHRPLRPRHHGRHEERRHPRRRTHHRWPRWSAAAHPPPPRRYRPPCPPSPHRPRPPQSARSPSRWAWAARAAWVAGWAWRSPSTAAASTPPAPTSTSPQAPPKTGPCATTAPSPTPSTCTRGRSPCSPPATPPPSPACRRTSSSSRPGAGPASGSRSPTRPAAPSTTATSSTTKTSA